MPDIQQYGAVWNTYRCRWELCAPDANVEGLRVVSVPAHVAQDQAAIIARYDLLMDLVKRAVMRSKRPQSPLKRQTRVSRA